MLMWKSLLRDLLLTLVREQNFQAHPKGSLHLAVRPRQLGLLLHVWASLVWVAPSCLQKKRHSPGSGGWCCSTAVEELLLLLQNTDSFHHCTSGDDIFTVVMVKRRAPSVAKAGVLCWTALSSSSRRSSSDRLLPNDEFMATAAESLLFCLLGKLYRV